MKNFKRMAAIVCVFTMLFSTMTFADTNIADYKGHWAEKTIDSWISQGLFMALDGNVQPDKAVTRAEFVKYVNRVYKFDGKAEINFTDVNINDPFYSDVAVAVKAGYIKGEPNGKFNPNKLISRAEVATIMTRLHNLFPAVLTTILAGFKDEAAIAPWCKGYISAVVNAGYMKGNGSSFNPNGMLTKAELATLLDRSGKDYYKLVLNKAGTYDIDAIDGNVLIDAPGVKVNNAKIAGNLFISRNVGEGEIYLNNVEVKGTTIVNGGGKNSIHFIDTILSAVIVDKDGSSVRLVAEGTTKIDKVDVNSGAKLEEKTNGGTGFNDISISGTINDTDTVILSGEFNAVAVKAKDANVEVEKGKIIELDLEVKATVEIIAGTVENIEISKDAEESKLEVNEGATVQNIEINAKILIAGTGKIIVAEVNVSGVVTEIKIEVVNKDVTITIEVVPVGTIGDVGPGNDMPSTPTEPSEPSDPSTPPSVSVTGITLSHETAIIEAGRTMQFTATVQPSNATVRGLIWRTDDISIATVDSNGLVTTYHEGTFLLFVTSPENSSILDKCVVTVTPGTALDFEGMQLTRAELRANSFKFTNVLPAPLSTNLVVRTSQAPVERPMFDQDFSRVFTAEEIIPLNLGIQYSYEGVAGEYVQVYGLDRYNKLKQFHQVQLTQDILSIPAPPFPAAPTVVPGSRRGTIRLNYTLPEGAASLWVMNVSYEYYHPALGSYSIHGGPYNDLEDMYVSIGVHVSLAACDSNEKIIAYHDLVITPELWYAGTPEEIALAEVTDAIYQGLNTQTQIDAAEKEYAEAAALIQAMAEGELKTQLLEELSWARSDIDNAKGNLGMDDAIAACEAAKRARRGMRYTQASIDSVRVKKDDAAAKVSILPESQTKADLTLILDDIQTAIDYYQLKTNQTNIIEGYRVAKDASGLTLEQLEVLGIAEMIPENFEAYKRALPTYTSTISYTDINVFFEIVNRDVAALNAVNTATMETMESALVEHSFELGTNLCKNYFELLDKTDVHNALIGKGFTDTDTFFEVYYAAVATAFEAQKNDIAASKVAELEALIEAGLGTQNEADAAGYKYDDTKQFVNTYAVDPVRTDLTARLTIAYDKINMAHAEVYISQAEDYISIAGLAEQIFIDVANGYVNDAERVISYITETSKQTILKGRLDALALRTNAIKEQTLNAQTVIDTANQAEVDAFATGITIESLLGTNTDANSIVSDLTLTQGEGEISVIWVSDMHTIINPGGEVTRPSSASPNIVVNMKAVVSKGNAWREIIFTFTVLAYQ